MAVDLQSTTPKLETEAQIEQRRSGEVTAWNLAFFPIGGYRFAGLVPGRFKHVAAFGYSHACRTWVIYDFTLAGAKVYLLPGNQESAGTIADWTAGATILKAPAPEKRQRTRWFGLLCVPAMRHLTGFRFGSLLPSGLYRGLVAAGAEVVSDPLNLPPLQPPSHADAQPAQ